MPLPSNPHLYEDVRQIFDAAIAAGGGTYTLGSPKEAAHWRHRAYNYRRLLFKGLVEQNAVPGYVPRTPYDGVTLVVKNNCVIITFTKPKGVFIGNDGTAATPTEDRFSENLLKDPL